MQSHDAQISVLLYIFVFNVTFTDTMSLYVFLLSVMSVCHDHILDGFGWVTIVC